MKHNIEVPSTPPISVSPLQSYQPGTYDYVALLIGSLPAVLIAGTPTTIAFIKVLGKPLGNWLNKRK
jgi:hypothetical protein